MKKYFVYILELLLFVSAIIFSIFYKNDFLLKISIIVITIVYLLEYGFHMKYWDYKRYNTAYIRCLCRDCLQIYKALPEFTVTRVNPLSKVKEKCDKCPGFGYDYFVYERSPRPKGGKGNG